MIVIRILLAIAVLYLAVLWIFYRIAFAVERFHGVASLDAPASKPYLPYRTQLSNMIRSAAELPYEDVTTVSYDGLRLHGRYYESVPGAPVHILFHGYRSHGIRDFSGGLPMTLKTGHNAILVDQRAHGESQGHCLTFGIKERRDVCSWVSFASHRFGADCPIFLVGISMGASTVLMSADLPMDGHVVGIIADCGYTSPRDIIRAVMAQRRYPVNLCYPLVRQAARLFAGFDPDSASALDALRRTDLPILLIHGENDDFVPCGMSRENYATCNSKKTLLTIPNAPHAISFVLDEKAYSTGVQDFVETVLSK